MCLVEGGIREGCDVSRVEWMGLEGAEWREVGLRGDGIE